MMKPNFELGQVLGKRAALALPRRVSAAAPMEDAVLFWGRKRLVLSDQLPFRVAQALPILLHAKPGEWEHFIRQAVAGGVL
jgi:hypothetical protein